MNNIRIGGVDEAFNIPWKRLCHSTTNLHWKDFDGGTGQLMRALNLGELDMAVVLTEGALLDIVKNNQAAILSFYVVSPLEWGIHVSNQSGIKKTADLRNKTIAVSRFGSGSHLMPMVMASELNWDIQEMSFLESMNMNGALRDLNNHTASVFFWEKHTTAPHLAANQLNCMGSYFSKWPAFSIAVKKEDCKERGEFFRSIVAGVIKEAQTFSTDVSSIDQIASYYQMQRQTAAQWMKQTKWITKPGIDMITINTVLRALHNTGLITALPDATTCICQ